MKKLGSILFLLLLTIVLIILSGHLARIAVKPERIASDKDFMPKGPQLPVETGQLNVTDILTYYVYLPIIPNPFSPKKGVGVTISPACADVAALRASWYLNWSFAPDGTCGGAAEGGFVPRISNEAAVQHLTEAIANAQPSGWLIGFNEPNLVTQANISPERGAQLWKQIEDAAIPAGIKLVSPAPNPDPPGHTPGDPNGYTWLMKMVEAYQNQNGGALPHFDAIGWHAYHSDPQVIKSYLAARYEDFRGLYPNAKVWVLEYNGCFVENNPEGVVREVTSWLEQQPWIERYAWFSNRRSPSFQGDHPCLLIDDNNNLTQVGQIYSEY
jgi:hypothetical protein